MYIGRVHISNRCERWHFAFAIYDHRCNISATRTVWGGSRFAFENPPAKANQQPNQTTSHHDQRAIALRLKCIITFIPHVHASRHQHVSGGMHAGWQIGIMWCRANKLNSSSSIANYPFMCGV